MNSEVFGCLLPCLVHGIAIAKPTELAWRDGAQMAHKTGGYVLKICGVIRHHPLKVLTDESHKQRFSSPFSFVFLGGWGGGNSFQ